MKSLKNVRKWFCFFEQSGTFKNEFKRLGYPAWDLDILDDFGQTDFQKDLFKEITAAYKGEPSFFDIIEADAGIIAFFPCVRFSVQAQLLIQCHGYQFQNYTDLQKACECLKVHRELHELYSLVTCLVIVCLSRDIPLVIENPWGNGTHYLTRYWPFRPTIIDYDRRAKGDYYKKPTQYWFFNCKPSCNLLFDEPIARHKFKRIEEERTVSRSMISKDYARYFIRSYLT